MAEPVAITSEVHSNNYVQALELNPNNGKLYWNSFYYFDFYGFFQLIYAELYEIDPATGEVVTLKDFEHEITALCIIIDTLLQSLCITLDQRQRCLQLMRYIG